MTWSHGTSELYAAAQVTLYKKSAWSKAFHPPTGLVSLAHVSQREYKTGAKVKVKMGWPHHGHLMVAASDSPDHSYDNLKVGSPVVIVEAPTHIKTAEPMPMMRPNQGFVMPGDAGRIISRKPKDVWAVRVKAGAFLLERKYFKPLDAE